MLLVPIKCNADVLLVLPVGRDLVLLLVREDAYEMVNMFFSNILYSEVVHY